MTKYDCRRQKRNCQCLVSVHYVMLRHKRCPSYILTVPRIHYTLQETNTLLYTNRKWSDPLPIALRKKRQKHVFPKDYYILLSSELFQQYSHFPPFLQLCADLPFPLCIVRWENSVRQQHTRIRQFLVCRVYFILSQHVYSECCSECAVDLRHSCSF